MTQLILGTVAQRVVSGTGSRRIHMSVNTLNTGILIAHTRNELENPLGLNGIPVTNAEGPIQIDWVGEMWAIAMASNLVPCYADMEIRN